MDQLSLYKKILKLKAPWTTTSVDLDDPQQHMTVTVSYNDAHFYCPICFVTRQSSTIPGSTSGDILILVSIKQLLKLMRPESTALNTVYTRTSGTLG